MLKVRHLQILSKFSICVACAVCSVQSLQCAHGRTVDSEPSSKLMHAREHGMHKIVSPTKRWLLASRTPCGPATTNAGSTGPTTGTATVLAHTIR